MKKVLDLYTEINNSRLWLLEDKVTRRIDGITYRLCPASHDKNMTCRDCGKCWKKNRKEVIVFPAHGAGKKKTRAFLMDF